MVCSGLNNPHAVQRLKAKKCISSCAQTLRVRILLLAHKCNSVTRLLHGKKDLRSKCNASERSWKYTHTIREHMKKKKESTYIERSSSLVDFSEEWVGGRVTVQASLNARVYSEAHFSKLLLEYTGFQTVSGQPERSQMYSKQATACPEWDTTSIWPVQAWRCCKLETIELHEQCARAAKR